MTNKCILSLDDDINYNNLLKKKFEKQNYDVVTTSDAKSFLKHFGEKNWDFFFIDINLNEGQEAGFKIIRLIREKLNSKVPIIVISKADQNEKIVHALECGASDYVTKPLDMAMILSKITYLTESNQLDESNTLKTITVPEIYRKCSISSDFHPYSLNEEGITLVGHSCISKGTLVEIKNTEINRIFNETNLKLMVTRNSKISEEKYTIFLEFGDTYPELTGKVKSWLIAKISGSKT